MLRQQKAWILLVAFMLWCVQGVLSLAAHPSAISCCASVSCCSGASCPMRSRPAAMPKSCPMASRSKSSGQIRRCACSVSPNESSFNLTAHADFRFDLPQSVSARDFSVCLLSPAPFTENILTGYAARPDPPPEFLS